MHIKEHIFYTCRRVLPYKIFSKITGEIYSEELNNMRKDIFTNRELLSNYHEEVAFMKRHGGLMTFPYNYVDSYIAERVRVYEETSCGLKYVFHCGKRLFFPEDWSKKKIQYYYNGLLIEQDINSPHRYFTDEYAVDKGIFIDVGCAEAMSSLEVLDKASELYLFECDPKWKKALSMTFEGYENKVHIITKYVSDHVDEEHTTLMEELKNNFNEVLFIKLDLNGLEWDVLWDSRKLLNRSKVMVFGTTYHHAEDAERLLAGLESLGFQCEFSKGYMLFTLSEQKYPYFRKGLIRAKNY